MTFEVFVACACAASAVAYWASTVQWRGSYAVRSHGHDEYHACASNGMNYYHRRT